MRIKEVSFILSMTIMALAMSGCDWLHKSSARETIFDKIVSIPTALVLNIPNLPPYCDEIPDLKKGFAAIENGKLYYEEEGAGIPLVLINGGPGGTHHGFHPYFSQIKDLARIIYYDQRGTGKSGSDATGTMYTVKQAVEDLESLRKVLQIEQWAVLGWSYGGLLAQCYALTYPDRVKGLILVASNTGIPVSINKYERDQQIVSPAERDAIEHIQKMVTEGKITPAQCAYNKLLAGNWKYSYYYKPTNDEFIRNALYVWNPAPNFEKVMRPESDKINLKGKFDDFEIPTLILEAKWDLQWWDPNRTDVMRRNHPHTKVEIFEKSGHCIFADEPATFFSLLRNFLEKSSKAHIAYKPGNRLPWPKPHSNKDSQ